MHQPFPESCEVTAAFTRPLCTEATMEKIPGRDVATEVEYRDFFNSHPAFTLGGIYGCWQSVRLLSQTTTWGKHVTRNIRFFFL
jgi:hypothetical protein